MTHQDDEMLLSVLKEAHQAALTFGDPTKLAGAGDPIWAKVKDALRAHGRFGKGRHIYAGGHQLALWPQFMSMTMHRPLRKYGPEGTIEWLHELFTVENVEVRQCAELIGVKIEERLILSNEVVLVPFDDMRSSYYADGLRAVHSIPWSTMGEVPRDIIGMYKVENVRFSDDHNAFDDGDARFLETALAVSVASNCAAVVGAIWSEYATKDYADAEFGYSHRPASYEGRSPRFQDVTLNASHCEMINRFLALKGNAKKACMTASARLNSARRRLAPGDAAIDIATALEALLGQDGEKTESTFKLRLRSALMLGKGLEEREYIFNQMRKLYDLRSRVVHGSSSSTPTTADQALVDWSIDACQRLLIMITEAARMPNLQKLVLTGNADEAFF